MRKKIVFYYRGYPFFVALGKALNADFYKAPAVTNSMTIKPFKLILSSLTLPKTYDYYFCEGTYMYPSLAKKAGIIKSKIITICGDATFYYIKGNLMRSIVRKAYINLLKEVDGFVCASRMTENHVKAIFPNKKTIVAYSYINEKLKKELYKKRNRSPAINSHRLLYIGRPDFYYKGIDLLLEAFEMVKKEVPDAELNIVNGEWNKKKMDWVVKYTNSFVPNAIQKNMPNKVLELFKDKRFGVNYLGRVDNLADPIKNASLFITLGRGDPFPATGIEAMSGGLPTMVSEETGTKDFIKKIDTRLIVPLNSKEICKRIIWYFSLKEKEKLKLSKKSIKIAFSKELNKKYILNKFVKEFNEMLNEIG
jgi:glycosyltransferase involved in cell wall biosynthesis